MDSVITLSNAILLGRCCPGNKKQAWVWPQPQQLVSESYRRANGCMTAQTPVQGLSPGGQATGKCPHFLVTWVGPRDTPLILLRLPFLLPSQGIILPGKFECGLGAGDICSLPYPRKGGFGFVFSKEEGENKFVFLECLLYPRHC